MRRIVVVFALMICTSSVFAGGFQVTAQDARAMGMGLAYTAVGGDAGAIYYNPAAIPKTGWDLVLGGMVATNTKGEFVTAAATEKQRDTYTFVPQVYATKSFGPLRAGVGVFAPFGLPIRWENPRTFSGRRVAYTSTLKSVTVNPTVAFDLGNHVSVGVGADWVHAKVQLERVATLQVGPNTFDIGDAKLKSDVNDASDWGWNAGVLWTGEFLRVGVAYRSSVDIDVKPKLTITQILTGIPAIDAGVAALLPPAPLDANVALDLPSSLSLGMAGKFNDTTLSVQVDRTDWSSFSSLDVIVPARPQSNITRATNWKDTWAYRLGVETPCTAALVCRAGYYHDPTPQPLADVGPVFPDADRQGITAGLGIGHGHISVDVAYVYVIFDDRSTDATSTDKLVGKWETTGNEIAVNLHLR